MPTPKEKQDIIRSLDPKEGIITYHLRNKNHKLPEYKEVITDGIKVRIILKDGSTRHLPDLNKGYELKSSDKYELLFKKAADEVHR